MFRATILYGQPKDPAEFDRYYRDVHIPLVKKIEGLKGFTMTKFAPAPNGELPPYFLMAALYAESHEAFNAALATPEGQATSADVRNFATGGVTFIFGEEETVIALS